MIVLAAQVGAAAGTEHAVVVDTLDPDDVIRRVLRGGLTRVRTVCGRDGRPHARVWNPDTPRACGRCRTATGDASGRSPT